MQEQNFEDDVRRKMEELSFAPSAPVWLEVEAQIRKKDKRRRLLLLWLLPLALFGGFMVYKSTIPNDKVAIRHSAPMKVTSKPNTQLIENKKVSLEEKQEDESGVENSIVSSTTQTSKATIWSSKETNSGSLQIKAKKQLGNKTKASDLPASETSIVENATTKSETLISNATTSDISVKGSEVPNPISSPDTITKSNTSATVTDLPITDTIKATPKQSAQTPKKWNWSLQVNVGISNLKQNLFGEAVAFERASPLTSTPQTPVSNTTPVLRRGAAISVDASVDRNLSKRLKLNAGLQYAYLSTRLGVGQKVTRDTAINTGGFSNTVQNVNGYYTPGNRSDYTTKYHFVQMPIGIEWKVFKAVPLSLNLGASISYLIETNHLERAANGAIYYKSSDNLAKTGVHLFGGLNYRVWHSSKHAVHAGPYIQWGLTPLQKDPARRAVFTGIQTKFSF